MAHRVAINFLYLALAAFCCIGPIVAAEEQQSNKLTVDIYYESLCPDSMYFINEELAPAFPDLKDFIDINLIPFGKASWVIEEKTNSAVFTCQHGANECRGNRAQACALHEIQQSLKPEDQQQKMVDVVNCVMANRYPASAVSQCVKKEGLSSESVERINTCSRSKFGNELLIGLGEKTKAFQNPLSFVPTIVVNGEKKPDAFRNFRTVICQEIGDEKKPSACKQN